MGLIFLGELQTYAIFFRGGGGGGGQTKCTKCIMGDSIPRIRTSEPAGRINVPFVVSRGHTVQKHFERTQLMSQCDFEREEN